MPIKAKNESLQQKNSNKIEIKNTIRIGNGIFAKISIKKGEIIETCPVLTFSLEDAKKIEQTALSDYWFAWRTDEDPNFYGAFCLGYGSFIQSFLTTKC